jgi:hypothetical protein
MEETSKSTTAFEGDDTDQKLPAEEKRSSKGSARENSERDAKRKAGRYGLVALNMAGERHHREKSDGRIKRAAKASRSAPTTPGAHSSTDSKSRKERRGDKASGSRASRPERDEKEAARRQRQGKAAVPGAHTALPSAARREHAKMAARLHCRRIDHVFTSKLDFCESLVLEACWI